MEAAVATTINIKSIVIFFLVLLNLSSASSSTHHHRHPSPAEFIRASCRSTRYPSLCEHSLSSYAPSIGYSPCRLAYAALSVSVDRARAASSFVGGLSSPPSARSPRSSSVRGGGGAVRDCLDTLADSVNSLRRSGREMRRMGRRGTRRFERQFGNVQTWISAALTDETTCLDSLLEDPAAGGSRATRAEIRKRILDVARVTSNALALVNRLQARN